MFGKIKDLYQTFRKKRSLKKLMASPESIMKNYDPDKPFADKYLPSFKRSVTMGGLALTMASCILLTPTNTTQSSASNNAQANPNSIEQIIQQDEAPAFQTQKSVPNQNNYLQQLVVESSNPVSIINTPPTRVTLDDAVVKYHNGFTAEGEDLTVKFYPEDVFDQIVDITFPKRGFYKRGDYPKEGTIENESIRSVQRLLGLKGKAADGTYGRGTTSWVLDWQRENFPNQKERHTGNFSKADWEHMSTDKAKLYGRLSSLTFHANDGKIAVEYDPSGLQILASGDVRIGVDNKLIDPSKDDLKILQNLFEGAFEMPVSFAYETNGSIQDEFLAQGKEAYIERHVIPELNNRPNKRLKFGKNKLWPKNQCAKHSRLSIEAVDPSISQTAGIVGDAWNVQANLIREGSNVTYRFSDSLSPEKANRLARLESRRSNYKNRAGIQSILKDVKLQEKLDVGILDYVMIFNMHSSSKSDAFQGTDYNTHTAIPYGRSFAKNPGVNIGASLPDLEIVLDSKSELIDQVASGIGLNNAESLHVDQVWVKGSGEFYQPAYIESNSLVDADGVKIEDANKATVSRLYVVHQFPGEVNFEPLSGMIDKNLRVYSVVDLKVADVKLAEKVDPDLAMMASYKTDMMQ